MSWFHVALGALAMFALLASWNVPRAGKWIFIASINYVVSVSYFRLGFEGGYFPPPIVVAFFCDVTCFVIIKQGHKRAWEFRTLGVIMMVMTTLDALMFASKVTGFPPMIPMTFYGSLQELLNAVYLLVIGGVGLMDLAHGYGLADRHSGSFVARLNAATQRETQVQKIRLK